MTTIIIIVGTVCLTLLALAFYKGDVSAVLKFFGVSLSLEAKDRHR